MVHEDVEEGEGDEGRREEGSALFVEERNASLKDCQKAAVTGRRSGRFALLV